MKRTRLKRKSKRPQSKARDQADKAWATKVKDAWGNVCAICGKDKPEAHHLIGKRVSATRYEVTNGIALCGNHHRLCPRISPHNGGVAFTQWLQDHHPSVAAWVAENKNRTLPPGTVKIAWYEEQKARLSDG